MPSPAAVIAARLERLPPGRAMWTRVVLISLGGFFEFYDMFLSAYVGPGLVKSGILTTTTPGLFGTTGLAGFVAAFFAGLAVVCLLLCGANGVAMAVWGMSGVCSTARGSRE